MNTVFENVDLSQVPSGILSDYSLSLVDDSLYNGQILSDNIVSSQIWRGLYSDLWSGEVNSNANMLDLASINNKIEAHASDDVAVIPILFYNYHRISLDALDRNLMYVNNGKLYDTPGRTSSPYISQTAFAATSMKSRFKTKGSLNFVFEQDCFFSNTGLTITNMQIDADDGGGYRTVSFGNVFTASYSNGGNKDLKVKMTFSNGSIQSCHFGFYVEKLSNTKSTRYFNTEILPISSSTVEAYKDKKAKGEVTIIYNGSTNVLDKPFIIFEGYDTWKILTPNDPGENVTWEDLLDSLDYQSYFNPSFQSELEARGYDLIFVDYENGTDYIQRNAYFAEAVIKAVNQKKVGNEANVVMGISMGGLVARYALADMENKSEEHDTHMYISMDSPHQGANVPLGIQALVRHLTEVKLEVGLPALGLTTKVWDLGDVAKDYPAFINLLQQPATRQMLIEQLSGFGNNFYIDNSIHDAFMQEYNQLGYPKKCRNIAISNGSGASNTSWQYQPGADVFDLSGDCKGDWWTDFLGGVIIAAAPFIKQLWEMPVIILASFLPGKYGVKINYNIKTLPYSGTARVYNGKIKFYKKILWLIKVSSTFTDESIDYTGVGLPWSSAQGGNQPIKEYTGTISDQLPSCLEFTPPSQENFCFVPEVSALDIQGTRDLLKGYRAENDLQNSKFDNFYTEPIENKTHTNFNLGNSNWIISEIDNDNLLKSLVHKLNDYEINGGNKVCSGGNTFSFSNIPNGVKTNWTHSRNISINSSTNTNAVMKSNGSGTGWVQAVFSGGGATAHSEKIEVLVGVPLRPTDIIFYPSVPCLNQNVIAKVRANNPTESQVHYNWRNTHIYRDQNSSGSEVHFQTLTRIYYTTYVRVKGTNECGSSQEYSELLSVENCNGGGIEPLQVSINPANENTELSFVEAAEEMGTTTVTTPPTYTEEKKEYKEEDFMYMSVHPNPANVYVELNFYKSGDLSEYQKSSLPW